MSNESKQSPPIGDVDYLEFLRTERNNFARVIQNYFPHEGKPPSQKDSERWTAVRVAAEDMLICFDQMREKLAGSQWASREHPTAVNGDEYLKGNEPISPSKAQPERIGGKIMDELKELAEYTGYDLNGIIAGWWWRIPEVQTLQIELNWANENVRKYEQDIADNLYNEDPDQPKAAAPKADDGANP